LGYVNDKKYEGFIDKNGVFKIIKGVSQFWLIPFKLFSLWKIFLGNPPLCGLQ
jgi:hypothetical protein